jgi:hypothetical protein
MGLKRAVKKNKQTAKKNEAFRQTHRPTDRFVRKGASRTEAVAEKTFFYNMTFTHKIEGFQNLRFPCGNLFFIHVFNINRGRHNFRKLLLYMREQLLHWEHAVVNQIKIVSDHL